MEIKSKCCLAPLKLNLLMPHDGSTVYYVCTKCENICDEVYDALALIAYDNAPELPSKEKKEEQICSCLETKLTWYVPSDNLPQKDTKVIFLPKNEEFIWTGEYEIIYEKERGFITFDGKVFENHEIKWWASLPTLE